MKLTSEWYWPSSSRGPKGNRWLKTTFLLQTTTWDPCLSKHPPGQSLDHPSQPIKNKDMSLLPCSIVARQKGQDMKKIVLTLIVSSLAWWSNSSSPEYLRKASKRPKLIADRSDIWFRNSRQREILWCRVDLRCYHMLQKRSEKEQ